MEMRRVQGCNMCRLQITCAEYRTEIIGDFCQTFEDPREKHIDGMMELEGVEARRWQPLESMVHDVIPE